MTPTPSIRWLPLFVEEGSSTDEDFLMSQRGSLMTVRGGHLRVDCPSRGQIDAADCVACPDCIGVANPRDGSPSSIACTWQPDPGVVAERGALNSRAGVATVASIMASPVVCAGLDDSIEKVVAVFLEHGISGVPVVDDAGRPVGLVTKTDLLRLARFEGAPNQIHDDLGSGLSWASWRGITTREVMVPLVLSVTEDATIAQAAALMAFEGVHRLPVVRGEKIVGLVSTLDVIRWLATEGGYAIPRARRRG